jgi:hypothetical protein
MKLEVTLGITNQERASNGTSNKRRASLATANQVSAMVTIRPEYHSNQFNAAKSTPIRLPESYFILCFREPHKLWKFSNPKRLMAFNRLPLPCKKRISNSG